MAEIPTIGGWGEGVGDLANGLSTLINPNRQLHEALKKKAVENPDLIPQLAELERSNPGTLEKLGLGNGGIASLLGHGSDFINQITGTPPSPDTELARQGKEANTANVQATTANTQANTSRTQALTPIEVKQKGSEANVQIGTEQAQIDNTKAVAEQNKAKSKEATTAIASLEAGLKSYPEIANIDLAGEAHKVFSGGKVDPALAARIQSDPALSSMFDSYMKALMERARLDTEIGIEGMKGRSKSELAVAFGVTSKQLEDAQKRLSTYQTALKNPPTAADAILAKEAGPVGEAAKSKLQAYGEAHSQLEQTKKDVEKYQGISDRLSSSIVDKAEKNPISAGTTKTKTTVKTQTSNAGGAKDQIVEQAKSAIKQYGLDKVKSTKAWKAMTPAQQKAAQGADIQL